MTVLGWSSKEVRRTLGRYEGFVQHTARGLAPLADEDAVTFDDLCASGRIAVLEALATATSPDELDEWVRHEVRGRLLDVLRAGNVDPGTDITLPPQPRAETGSMVSGIQGLGTAAQVEAALEGLPPRERRAVELRLYQGLSAREIGALMAIGERKVRQLQASAVAAVRQVLARSQAA